MNVLPIETKSAIEALDIKKTIQTSIEKEALAAELAELAESHTSSSNIQAAGKLTTTSSPKVRKEKSDPYECPNTSEFSFFPHYCSRHANCISVGKEYRCCRQFNSKRCVKGVPKPLKEQRHERKFQIFFCFLYIYFQLFIVDCRLLSRISFNF